MVRSRINKHGQVTIPKEIRERSGLLPGTEVELRLEGGEVRIVRCIGKMKTGSGARLVQRLRGSATVRMTTEEIMALTRDVKPKR